MSRKLPILIILTFLISGAAATSFGTTSGPLPNVTELRIYDVTGAANKEIGGTLEDSGLNKTFSIDQASEREYRFSFRIENRGDQNWPIEAGDTLFHNGLDTGWTVNRVWYNITADFDGGSFSTGKVDWDTSNTGVLESQADNDTMYAKYLVNITAAQSQQFSQRFLVNDTSNSSGSQDYHRLNVTKYGYLELDMLEPPNDTVVRVNKSFIMNASATCRNGECGQVSLSARDNSSGSFTSIPLNTGEPFNTNNSNPRVCDNDLKKDETCYVSWFVNATGPVESYHLIDVSGSSDVPEVQDNDSENHLVQINTAIIMDLNWSTIDFGLLDPGARNKTAKNNSDRGYNISISADSNPVDDLWVKATDLRSDKLDYTIFAENISYSLQNDIDTEKPLSNTYSHVISSISPGTVLTTYYWIDVPFGIYEGGYTGSIYFKANSTGG